MVILSLHQGPSFYNPSARYRLCLATKKLTMSDEVSDFLRSVEELKERREQEDEARSRELEEKFLQERAERQARRAGTELHEISLWLNFTTVPSCYFLRCSKSGCYHCLA